MSVARTARRRRSQYKLGKPGLEQVFGKRHAPHYAKQSASKSARRLAALVSKIKQMQMRKKG